jgi:hypothetical protein
MAEIHENFILDLKTVYLAQQLDRLHSRGAIGGGLSEGFNRVLVTGQIDAS